MKPGSLCKEELQNLLSAMNDHGLRRVVSDVSTEMDKFRKEFEVLVKINEVEGAECECCGLIEDCTPDYIKQVMDSHCGKWVCGLCSEAIKEKLKRAPSSSTVMEEAVSSHKEFCLKFNKTIRVNPKLSFAWAMRDIVKKRFQHRNKIARSSSFDPGIDFLVE